MKPARTRVNVVKTAIKIITVALLLALFARAASAADSAPPKKPAAKPAAGVTAKKEAAPKAAAKTTAKKTQAAKKRKPGFSLLDKVKAVFLPEPKAKPKATPKAAPKVAPKTAPAPKTTKPAPKTANTNKAPAKETVGAIGIAHAVGEEPIAPVIPGKESFMPMEPETAPANAARVTRIEFTRPGAPDVWINQGVMRGIIPAMSLEIVSGGKVVGRIEIEKANSETAMGVFSAACKMCLPQVGDYVKLSGKSFSLLPSAPINVPGAGIRPGAGSARDDDKLQAAFKDFMSGKVALAVEPELTDAPPPDLPDPTPARELPRCPAGSAEQDSGAAYGGEATSGLDEDIKTGYYLEHGDRIRIEDWPPYSPFCPAVDMKGYIRLPEVGLLSAARRTPASLEQALRQKLKTRGIKATPVLIPIPADAMPAPSEFFVLGEIAGPGHYEFDGGETTLSKAVEIAGGALPASDGTAVVVDDLSKKWQLRLLKLNGEQIAGQPAVGDRAVIFLPASRESLEQFIRDVLPYLSD
ncbi:MAG: hypothetical protein WCX65_07740 [bacterium]